MNGSVRAREGNAIPLFPLYGERTPWQAPDLVHCETIASRSRRHGWVIAPHRHADLGQLLWVARGRVAIQLDGREHRAQGPVLQFVPPMCVHGFVFSEDVQGHVVTLAAPLLAGLAEELGAAGDLRQPLRLRVGESGSALAATFAQLHEEYHQRAPGREAMLRALSLQPLVHLLRDQADRGRPEPAPPPRRARELQLERYRELVEQHFRKHLPVGYFAQRLGISIASLNRICRDLAGTSAQGLLHQRLLLEAKRDLAYTHKPIQVVAEELGFSDPAYFSRFFSRAMGCPPSSYRARACHHLDRGG